ncbi:unnamed protein product [Rhodiola kirilowii]
MALTSLTLFYTKASSIISSSSSAFRHHRRRIPLVKALCVLTFRFSNILPSVITASSFFTSSRSQPLRKPLGSNFDQAARARTIAMATSGNTVPSIVVYVTVPNKELGIESVYQWKGEIQTDSEELLIIKTRESLLEALTEHVKANHEYEVPEVIALPITGGSIPYLEWIKSNTRD